MQSFLIVSDLKIIRLRFFLLGFEVYILIKNFRIHEYLQIIL